MLKLVHQLQDRIARAVGLSPAQRPPVIAGMLAPRSGEAAGYWLQLLMAGALATLGLALDSTAVVIGAMLIAPLMRPIVELAMGLATGSAPLVFRAGTRALASVAAVVVASAAIAWLLPFHEITRELVARTAPSMLDLFVAAACALVGAYATMFSAGDMATTAAGTSIGISLVPPLCTLGYGISIKSSEMAVGAGLLFTANITGILMVASLVFVLVGFGQVTPTDLDEPDQAQDLPSRLGRRWSRRSARLGALSRLLLPVFLLAVIYLPLRRAVGDMSTRSAIRSEVGDMLAASDNRVAQSTIDFDGAGAIIRVVIVGDATAAKDLEARVAAKLRSLGEHTPRVTVWAVPDASSLGALARRLDAIPPPAAEPPPPRLLSQRPAREIWEVVAAAWPKATGGELLAVWVTDPASPRLRVVHLGAPIGAAGMQLLATAVAPDDKLTIDEDALTPVTEPAVEAARWLPRALSLLERAARNELWVCLVAPTPPQPDPARPRVKVVEDPVITEVRKVLEAYLATQQRVTLVAGDQWIATPSRTACPQPAEPAPENKDK